MAAIKRKKRFFNVEIPLINKTTQLQGFEVKDLGNRFIKYDLTRMLKGKSVLLSVKTKLEGEEITTTPREIRLMPYYLKRMVRKGTNYVEDSFSTECKDSQLRIKPFLITRRKVSRAVRKALREMVKAELIEYSKDKPTIEIFKDILSNQLQKALNVKLKKIYPLSLCEIRVLKVEKNLTHKE